MSYVARLRSRISKYTPDDHTELLSFRRRMWPNLPIHPDDLHWKWQFLDNPGNPTPIPEIWVFKDNGQIVGQQAAIPALLKVRETYCRCSWGIDLMVDPRFRTTGVGCLLAREMNGSTDVSLALGVSDSAYSMYMRDGWIDLGLVPRFVKILDAKPLIQKKLRLPIIAGVLSALVNIHSKIHDFQIMRRLRDDDLQIDQIERFDSSFDDLWQRIADRFLLIVRRDSSYLNWRYVSQPGMNYKIFQTRHRNELLGYIVLRTGSEGNRRVGYIVDFLAAPEQLTPLIAMSIQYFRKQSAVTIICNVLNRKVEELLEKLGFYRRESNERFMIRVNKSELPLDLLQRRDDWFVVRGDSDMDRPWN